MEPPIVKPNPALTALYAKLYAYIQEGMQEAERTGKPLYIAVGEKHGTLVKNEAEPQLKSTMVEVMAIDIAHKLGIRTLTLEMDKNLLSRTTNGIAQTEGDMDAIALDMSISGKMRLIPNDPARETRDNDVREKAMIETVAKRTQPAIGIYGATHLKALDQSSLQNTHTLLLINATNLSEAEKFEVLTNIMKDKTLTEKEFNEAYSRDVSYVSNSKNAFQAEVKGDIRKTAGNFQQVKQVVADISLAHEQHDMTALEQKEQDYIHQLESVLSTHKITLSSKAKEELVDIYVALKASGNQLQSEEFSKELNDFTAKLTPAVKTQIDGIKR